MYRKLSFISIFLLGINSVVGSGIFILPSSVFKSFGPYSVLAIGFAVILALLFGLCFAEMSGIYDQGGGVYAYARNTFGNFVGFNIGFLNCFSATMTWSTSAVAFTQVLSAFFPAFLPGTVWCLILPPTMIIITTGIALLGISESTLVNDIIAYLKIIALLVFCGVGIFFVKGSYLTSHVYIPSDHLLEGFISTTLIFFYALTGFEMLPLASNTMKNPKRNLPLALVSVIFFVGIFYAMILFVCIGLLGPNLAESTNPVAQAFSVIAGKFGFNFIWVASLVSILGILVATSFEAPRSLSPLSSDGFLHKSFASESSRSVPVVSILTLACIASIISMTGSFEVLAQAVSFVLLILYMVPAVAVIVSRRRKITSSFRVPLYPLVPILTILLSLYLISNVSPSEIIYGLTAILFGIIIYFMYAAPMKKRNS